MLLINIPFVTLYLQKNKQLSGFCDGIKDILLDYKNNIRKVLYNIGGYNMIKKLRQFHTHKFDAWGKRKYYYFSTVNMPVVTKLMGINPRKSYEFLQFDNKL